MTNQQFFRAAAFACCLSTGAAAGAATIGFDRASVAGLSAGDQFALEILGSDFADGSAGGGLNLQWNPAVLGIASPADIELLFPGDRFVFDKGVLDETAGTLTNLATVSFTGIADASFAIARITFTALAAGNSPIELALGTFAQGGDNVWTTAAGAEIADLAFEPAAATVVATVPVPAGLWLLPGALALLGGRLRRRRQDFAA